MKLTTDYLTISEQLSNVNNIAKLLLLLTLSKSCYLKNI